MFHFTILLCVLIASVITPHIIHMICSVNVKSDVWVPFISFSLALPSQLSQRNHRLGGYRALGNRTAWRHSINTSLPLVLTLHNHEELFIDRIRMAWIIKSWLSLLRRTSSTRNFRGKGNASIGKCGVFIFHLFDFKMLRDFV